MTKKKKSSNLMRIIHRYLGFFLAGIMAVYALSGIILIFRDTDFLKQDKNIVKTIAPNLNEEDLGKELHLKKLKAEREEGDIVFFKEGTYNKKTGVADYKTTSQPFIIEKMNHLHKAKTGDPLFFLNIFFGVSLFFFVISTFWMFTPKTTIFKKGMYFTAAGIVLTLIMLFL
ncbi:MULTISPECIES: PepSY domain-containing protein [unclassified Flavobacterium]|uniref:PepSY domain-containing protein n=1 Tax=unclassified Flavobacterium TaxID=196869 RepID=UPI001570908A|nr:MULTISPECIES: PepSY domain-containing protein [unclassified Flavobacterium]MBE0392499.1 hypothetical protein [Flavobacterium sp. PL002]NRT14457.1 hypothetical protein [Flavobacterium sp. 28A]